MEPSAANDTIEDVAKPQAETTSAAASSEEKSAKHMKLGDLVRITDRYVFDVQRRRNNRIQTSLKV